MEAKCFIFSVLMTSVYYRTGTLCTTVGIVGCCPDPTPSPLSSSETLTSAAKNADVGSLQLSPLPIALG